MLMLTPVAAKEKRNRRREINALVRESEMRRRISYARPVIRNVRRVGPAG
jgi:hypothetical protein